MSSGIERSTTEHTKPTEKRPKGAGVSPARRFAFEALRRIEMDAAFSSFLPSFAGYDRLSARDRAFAHELSLGVLRRRGALDFVLEALRGGEIGKLDKELVLILRLGLYQLLFLTRVPAYAAVSESVTLCRTVLGHKTTGLVNAILR